MLRQLNLFVVSGASRVGKLRESRVSELKTRVSELNVITESLLTRVRELIGNRRIFGYAFVYDGMDYCKVVMQEMRQLRTILTGHGLEMENHRQTNFGNEPLPSQKHTRPHTTGAAIR